MESEEESEEDVVVRKREQRDDDGRPVYKLGITLGQKRDKDGETIVIIDEVADESTAYGLVKPNRVLVMVNKEICTCVDEAHELINKAKRSPSRPLELTLRTQTKRVDESGAKAQKAKKAKVIRRQDALDLRDCDLLILSPRQLAPSNFLRAQLENMEFHRLIVDESHLVGKVHQGEEINLDYLLQVRAAHVWLLTGTPYSAGLAELRAQCRLLGQDAWLAALQQSVSNEAAADTLRELMIRHTKAQRIHGQVALALPRAAFKVVQLELSTDEMKLYQQHLCMSSTTLSAGALPGAASNAVPPPKPFGNVRLLLKHLEDHFMAPRLALVHKYTAEPLRMGTGGADPSAPTQILSTKYQWVEQELRSLLAAEPNMRVVIFTHYDEVQSKLVQWLAALARSSGGTPLWKVDDINLRTPAVQRHRTIADFQATSGAHAKGARLFVATLSVAAVGLTLTAATRVFLLEPTFDPSVVAQAAGRIHRLGQKREICVYQLSYKSTLDEAILKTHDKIRDGTLALQNGDLPDDVKALFDQHRRSHKWTEQDNSAVVAAGWKAVRAISITEQGSQPDQREGGGRRAGTCSLKIPLRCSFRQCVHCGGQKDHCYELDVPPLPNHGNNPLNDATLCPAAPGAPRWQQETVSRNGPRSLTVRVGYHDADEERQIRMHVTLPAQAQEGNVVTFGVLPGCGTAFNVQLKDVKAKGRLKTKKSDPVEDTQRVVSAEVRCGEEVASSSPASGAVDGAAGVSTEEKVQGRSLAVKGGAASGSKGVGSQGAKSQGGKSSVKKSNAPMPTEGRDKGPPAAEGKRQVGGAPVTILFQGFDDATLKQYSGLVASLHGQVILGDKAANIDIAKVTHFVVNTHFAGGKRTVKRSMKLCLAISVVQDIVTEDWMGACEMAKQFVPVQPYLLSGTFSSDAKAVSSWSFDATEVRVRRLAGSFLAGRSFHLALNKDSKEKGLELEYSAVIKAAGGVIQGKPNASSDEVIVISSDDARRTWAPWLSWHHVTLLRQDHLLTCILRQQLDLSTGLLS